MEEVNGMTLADFFKKNELSKEEKRILFIKLVETVQKFHEIMFKNGYKNFTHSDLHWENIMVTENKEIRLVDMNFIKGEYEDDWKIIFAKNYKKLFDLDNEDFDIIRKIYVYDPKYY